jgi:alpha-beta hydrolase superfamily lysophospholipase
MGGTHLTVNVAEAAGLDLGEVAATVFLPDPVTMADQPVVCFGFPGGGYNRSYFSMDLPGWDTEGQAAWHCERGWIFVAIDHLQVGDSTTYDPDLLTFEQITLANKAVVESVLAQLADGLIAAGFPAVTNPFTVGIGQSMGGCFTVLLQGQHDLFDCVGILGYSAIQTVVPSKPGVPNVAMPFMSRIGYPNAPMIFNMATLAGAATAIGDADDLAAATVDEEHVWTWAFHHDDEPADLVAADMAAMTGGPVPSWRSATVPACAILMVAPGAVATEAASITSPVLVAVGERDVVPDPWMEPKAYKSSNDITVYVCPRMAHMHNFAPTRVQFWTRLHGWVETIASVNA